MTAQQSLAQLALRWRTVASCAVVGLLCAIAYYLLVPSQYTAKIELYVSAQTTDTTNAAYQGGLLSQQRVKSYSEIVSNPRVTQQVISELQLDDSPQSLGSRIVATSSPDSVLLDIAVSDTQPVRAAEVADAVGRVFIGVVDELERPARPNAVQPVSVRVVAPAEVPSTPSSPGLILLVAVGALAGCAIGSGLALAMSILNTKLLNAEQLKSITDAPLLGEIPSDRAAAENVETTLRSDVGSWVESFKELRTNVQFVGHSALGAKVLAVSSSVAGEGKSTVSAGLAVVLAQSGLRTLLIDGDLRRPRVAKIFGVEGSVGLSTVLSDRARLVDALQSAPGLPNLQLLTAGVIPPNPSELLASQTMIDCLNAARMSSDVVIIDTPPLLPVTDAAAIAPQVNGLLLICRISSTRSTEVQSAQEKLSNVSGKVLGLVATMSTTRTRAKGADYYNYQSESSRASQLAEAGDKRAEGKPTPTPYIANADSGTTRPVPHRRLL